MLRVEKPRYNDGMKNAVLDIQVSTAAELPSLNDVVCGLKIIAGSIAQVIQTGAWYTLDDNGTWYDTSGNAPSSESSASSLNASLSMSPTLGKAIANSTDDMIDLTEDDIDRISGELEQAETPVKEQKKEYVESIEEPEKDGEDDDELL